MNTGTPGGTVYAACERVLRPGGVLAVLTAPAGDGLPAGLPGSAVAAARAAGLVYTQHIVLLHASIDGDRLDPGPVPARPADPLHGVGVHSDLLVLPSPEGPAHDPSPARTLPFRPAPGAGDGPAPAGLVHGAA